MDERLNRLQLLSMDPSNILMFSFGERQIRDPESERMITVQGYDEEKNKAVINYLVTIDTTFTNLFNCVKDVFFFEEIFSADLIPEFNNNEKYGEYLKIQLQHWIIKLITVYDCILHALNEVYELGIPEKSVKENTVGQKLNIKNKQEIAIPLSKLKRLLTNETNKISKYEMKKSYKRLRNEIVHTYDLTHDDIDELITWGAFLQMDIIDNYEIADFQNRIGITTTKIIDDIKEINSRQFDEVYSLLFHMSQEYRKQLDLKIVK